LNGRMLVRVSDDRADAERLDELTAALRRELLDLGVGEVRRVSEGQPPEGARAVDAATVNALLVGLTHSMQAVTAVVTLVRTWVDVAPAAKRSVELTLGDKTLKVSSISREQQDRLVGEFLRAVAAEPAEPANGAAQT
jgi:hypothetical protein